MSNVKERKLELENKRKKTRNVVIMSIIVIILAGLGVYYMTYMNVGGSTSNFEPLQTPASQTNGEIRIPISEIEHNAKFYSYETSDGVTVRYFAVIGPEGEVHVAIDACDLCYGANKGYRQIDDVMHCVNCGREFPIRSIGTENTEGGCWPSFIPIAIDSDDVVIKTSDLEEKGYMFS